MLALYSCSMHAAVTTDGEGRGVAIESVRIESSLRRAAVAMPVAGGHVDFEFRWLRAWSGVVDAPDGNDAP